MWEKRPFADFYQAAFNFWLFYCALVRTTMSAVLVVVMNCGLSFRAEKAESGEIAVQQNVAHVTIRICMCELIGKNDVRVACCGACWWPQSIDNDCP